MGIRCYSMYSQIVSQIARRKPVITWGSCVHIAIHLGMQVWDSVSGSSGWKELKGSIIDKWVHIVFRYEVFVAQYGYMIFIS